jgi:hypothetical protein
VNKGFTERQARFLAVVMRHSGVCFMRQYSTFAGIVFGQKTRVFFDKLVERNYASTYDCAHNRARIYHVRHRSCTRPSANPIVGSADRPPSLPPLPEIVIEDFNADPKNLLRPALDVLWQHVGEDSCPYFLTDGTWNLRIF